MFFESRCKDLEKERKVVVWVDGKVYNWILNFGFVDRGAELYFRGPVRREIKLRRVDSGIERNREL